MNSRQSTSQRYAKLLEEVGRTRALTRDESDWLARYVRDINLARQPA